MKNKKICIVICTLAIVATFLPVAGAVMNNLKPCPPLIQIEWEATYGGELIDWGDCIQQTTDGGYIISGTYFRNAWSLWYSYFYLLKIDANGNEEWNQTYGLYDSEHVAKSIQQTSDGGYIVAGYQGVTYMYDAIVQKTDDLGNIIWSATFGDPNEYDAAHSVQQTSDGGYIITGFTNSYGAELGDALLIKLNATGSTQWIQTLGGADNDAGYCVQQTSDGGYIIAGETSSYTDSGDVYLVKTDSSGNEQWHKTFGGNEWDGAYCVDQTTDGGYIISGYYGYEDWTNDVYLIKTDSLGNEEWTKYFGGTDLDEGYCVQQTSDGGYFVTGYSADPVNYDPDVYLIKTDVTGNMQWNQIIDDNSTEDYGYYGIETTDGEYIIAGYTGFNMEESVDVWVIKLGSGNEGPNAPTIDGPANGKTGVKYNYTFTATDPDGDNLYYYVCWGESCGCGEWVGPYTSGEEVVFSHSWSKKGTYEITAKVKDTSEIESNWTTFEVSMPRNKLVYISFLQLLFERFSNTFQILKYLSGL